MNNKVCLIRQPSGLGDIFFSQKIAQVWIDGGYKVVWPVEDHYYEYMKYLDSEVEFCSLSSDFIRKDLFDSDVREFINEDDFVYIPLQYSFEMLSGGIPYNGVSSSFLPREIHPGMQAKYYLTQIDYNDWPDYFNFTRNTEREDHLFYDILDLKDDYPFVLSNRNFAAGLNSTEDFSFVSDFPVLEMSMLDDVLLFDWCKVFEEAFEIHTVDTAVSFVLEKMPNLTNNLFVYKRTGYQSYEDLNLNTNMFTKPWTVCGE